MADRDLLTYNVHALEGPSPIFSQRGTGAVGRTAEDRLRDTVHVNDFGAVPDGATDNSTALTNAITYANSIGARLDFGAGVYSFATTLVFKNKVHYKGHGKDISGSVGTVLKYTGNSDAIQINNTINISTSANITVEDLWIACNNRTAGKAALADVASTFLSFKRVGFSGNDYGLILDQSKLACVDECDFELPSTGTAGLWLVNGADHTAGASILFTNNITVRNCQFNSVGGIHIIDDGGVNHRYVHNNFNGGATQIRMAYAYAAIIEQNEMESATAQAIDFELTRNGGAATQANDSIVVQNNLISGTPSTAFIKLAANSINGFLLTGTHFNGTGGTTNISGLLTAAVGYNYIGYLNYQVGAGDTNLHNSLQPSMTAYTPTFASSIGDAALGNGTITGEYVRSGGLTQASINLTIGSGTTLGTGVWRFGLPTGFGSINTQTTIGSWYANRGGTFYAGSALNGGAGYLTLVESTTGQVGGTTHAWANGDFIAVSMTYTGNPLQ